ncbi:LapA family protein, partial [Oscillatoriales cyanobacterium LEGE 11467]
IVAISILSVQNATLVSLSFLTLRSVQMPLGVVLGASVGIGLLGGAVTLMGPSIFKSNTSRSNSRDSRSYR